MKGISAAGLCIWLGCLTASSTAQETPWRAASRPPAVALQRPVARSPQVASPTPIHDPQLLPTSHQISNRPALKPVVRFQEADPDAALPEPQWPTENEEKQFTADGEGRAPEQKESVAPVPVVEAPPSPTPTLPCEAPLCSDQVCCAGPPGRGGRLYGGAEYLLWWVRNSSIPPLVTTGPVAGQGILGQPGTVTLFGGGDLDHSVQSGGRFTLGYWLDPCQTCGVESTFFFLGERATKFSTNSDAIPLLARPFFNQNLGTEFSEIISDPNRQTGGVSVVAPTRLWGIEANLRRNLCCGCNGRIDLIGGFRYLDLDEGVHVTEFGTLFPNGQPFGGSSFLVFDNFDTRNQFYGGQLGLSSEVRRGRWFVNMRGLVALGSTHQSVEVAGGQTLTAPDGSRQNFRGGLLALPSNSGRFTRDQFSVVPEGGLNVGYYVTPNLRAYVGYTFLYWTNVVRPGDQIDRVLDVNQVPNFIAGPPVTQVRPVVPFRQTDFWAQGVNFGLELRY